MALSDKLKDLRSKAEEAVVERKDQINQAVQKAGEVADQRTGGRYHEKIQKVGGKAVGLVDSLEGSDTQATTPDEVTGTAQDATPHDATAPETTGKGPAGGEAEEAAG